MYILVKAIIAVFSTLAIVIVVAACWILFQNSRDNSFFDYQYNRAIECAADNHYDEAISYLEKQLHWIQMQQAQDSFWLNITIKMVSSKVRYLYCRS